MAETIHTDVAELAIAVARLADAMTDHLTDAVPQAESIRRARVVHDEATRIFQKLR